MKTHLTNKNNNTYCGKNLLVISHTTCWIDEASCIKCFSVLIKESFSYKPTKFGYKRLFSIQKRLKELNDTHRKKE